MEPFYFVIYLLSFIRSALSSYDPRYHRYIVINKCMTRNIQMTLQEIFAAQQPYRSLSDREIDSVQQYVDTNTTNSVSIEGGKYLIKQTADGFFVLTRTSGEAVGWVKLIDQAIHGNTYAMVDIIYIRREARGTRAFLMLLNAIRHLASKPILLDGPMFDDGVKTLNALARREEYKVCVIDKRTGSTQPYDGKINLGSDYAIVVEGFDYPLGQSTWCVPGATITEWKSFCFFDV